MHLVSKNEMQANLVFDFAYGDDPSIFSKVVFLDFIKDKEFIGEKKMITGYWEAPVGSYDFEFDSFNEIAYLIEGEVDFVSEKKKMTVKKDDYYFCAIGEKFKIIIKKPVKMFLMIYPIEEKDLELYKNKLIKQ